MKKELLEIISNMSEEDIKEFLIDWNENDLQFGSGIKNKKYLNAIKDLALDSYKKFDSVEDMFRDMGFNV